MNVSSILYEDKNNAHDLAEIRPHNSSLKVKKR